jgi:hypothetical protein|tara:strand:+ start:1049 stop:1804 length:756 start_codon:yes stop_codon:yes gene_type:complete
MARISTYSIDTLDVNDKLHGTDQNGNTRNFKVGPTVGNPGGDNSATLVNYITEASTNALAFKFHNANFGGLGSRQSGTISVTGTDDQTDFSSVTTLKVSKFPYAASLQTDPKTAVNIITYLVGERIKFSDIQNPNIFGIYNLESFVQDGSTDFYDMGLQYISGNGQFTAGNNSSTTPDIYLLEVFGSDLHYDHTQSSSSATWSITHNLNKYPSVVIRTGSGSKVHAAITHNSKNALTITFAEAQTGSAHLN